MLGLMAAIFKIFLPICLSKFSLKKGIIEYNFSDSKRHMHHYAYAALFTIAKIWKQPKCPSVDEWIKKKWYIYTMEHYSAIRRNKSYHLPTTWMELEDITLSEISQAEKDKCQMISLICGV